MVGRFVEGGLDQVTEMMLIGRCVSGAVTGFDDIWGELGGIKLKGGVVGDIILISE